MKPFHKIAFLLIVALFSGLTLWGQQGTPEFDFYKSSNQISNTGMIVLGSWAIGNMVWGAHGWKNKTGSEMYFHQMNLFWNVVNLSIAGISIYNNFGFDEQAVNYSDFLLEHQKTERILLINSGLDAMYIGTGWLLNKLSQKNAKRADLLKGYGNSLYLQGGFLFAFDLVLYGFMHAERLQLINGVDLAMNVDFSSIRFTLFF